MSIQRRIQVSQNVLTTTEAGINDLAKEVMVNTFLAGPPRVVNYLALLPRPASTSIPTTDRSSSNFPRKFWIRSSSSLNQFGCSNLNRPCPTLLNISHTPAPIAFGYVRYYREIPASPVSQTRYFSSSSNSDSIKFCLPRSSVRQNASRTRMSPCWMVASQSTVPISVTK